MNKIIVTLSLLIFSITSFAQSNLIEHNNLDDALKWLSQPDSGIKVVPHSQINQLEQFKAREIDVANQMQAKGYVFKDEPYIKRLLSIGKMTKEEVHKSGQSDPYGTGLTNDYSNIKLAFKFNGFNNIKDIDVIAYTPVGGNVGVRWTGISAFFNAKNIGTCQLSLYNIKLSHGGALLDESHTTYGVNKKPTVSIVEGSPKGGFMYSLSWYDNTFVHDLVCASLTFDKNKNGKLIDIAKTLDKSLDAQ